jgi:hypothetical protein
MCNTVDAFFSPVEHTSALDRAVVGNPLAETPSTGRSDRLGQESRRKPPSGTVRLGLPRAAAPTARLAPPRARPALSSYPVRTDAFEERWGNNPSPKDISDPTAHHNFRPTAHYYRSCMR